MYDKVDCYNCLDYEYDDPSISNNCIHYRYCLAKVREEEKKKELKDVNNG